MSDSSEIAALRKELRVAIEEIKRRDSLITMQTTELDNLKDECETLKARLLEKGSADGPNHGGVRQLQEPWQGGQDDGYAAARADEDPRQDQAHHVPARIRHILDKIPYKIMRSDRKSAVMYMRADGLEIKVPYNMPQKEIWDFVAESEVWIIEEHKSMQMGRRQFTTKMDESYVVHRTMELARQMDVFRVRVVLKHLKTKFSSSTPHRVITINTRLLVVPKEVMDYIIISELCRIRTIVYGDPYWDLLNKHMPNHAKHSKWIKDNAQFL